MNILQYRCSSVIDKAKHFSTSFTQYLYFNWLFPLKIIFTDTTAIRITTSIITCMTRRVVIVTPHFVIFNGVNVIFNVIGSNFVVVCDDGGGDRAWGRGGFAYGLTAN